MQTVSEILKKVRSLEIKSKKLTTNLFTGEYHSAFKGRGMSFKEVREYAAGDDIRFIDWNTSARFGHPYSKVFEEERELTLMLILDCSASNLTGSHSQQKKELIIEMASILAFSAISNNDKVGALLFTNKVEQFIPPKKGKEHIMFIIRQMLTAKVTSKKTDISEAIRFFNQIIRQRAIVFLLSDFDDNAYTKALKTIAHRHDCIAIQIHDRIEYHFPKLGLVPMQDAETNNVIWVDSSNKNFKEQWHKTHHTFLNQTAELISQCGWDYLQLETGQDYVRTLQRFFIKRIKK